MCATDCAKVCIPFKKGGDHVKHAAALIQLRETETKNEVADRTEVWGAGSPPEALLMRHFWVKCTGAKWRKGTIDDYDEDRKMYHITYDTDGQGWCTEGTMVHQFKASTVLARTKWMRTNNLLLKVKDSISAGWDVNSPSEPQGPCGALLSFAITNSEPELLNALLEANVSILAHHISKAVDTDSKVLGKLVLHMQNRSVQVEAKERTRCHELAMGTLAEVKSHHQELHGKFLAVTNARSVAQWSPDDVRVWLQRLTLDEHSTLSLTHTDMCRFADLDGNALLQLDAPSLCELGVLDPVQRLAFLCGIAKVAPANACLRALLAFRRVSSAMQEGALTTLDTAAEDVRARQEVFATRARTIQSLTAELEALVVKQQATQAQGAAAVDAVSALAATHAGNDAVDEADQDELKKAAATRDEVVVRACKEHESQQQLLANLADQVETLSGVQQGKTETSVSNEWVDKAASLFDVSANFILASAAQEHKLTTDAEAVAAVEAEYKQALVELKQLERSNDDALLASLVLGELTPDACEKQTKQRATLRQRVADLQEQLHSECISFQEKLAEFLHHEYQRVVEAEMTLESECAVLTASIAELQTSVRALQGRVEQSLGVFVSLRSVAATRGEYLDRYETVLDDIDDADRALEEAQLVMKHRAKSRRKPKANETSTQEAEANVQQKVANLRRIKYGVEMKRSRDNMLTVAASFPETPLLFPELSGFHGTGTDVVARSFAEYKNVTPIGVDAGPCCMLRVSAPPIEPERTDGDDDAQWRDCVLKEFGVEDSKMLRRSVRVLSQLSHPNIIPLLGVCERIAERKWYLELPYVPLDLRARMESKEEPRLDESEVIQLLMGVLQGIHCLHSHGLIHRDIKPENVLLDVMTSPNRERESTQKQQRYRPLFD